jgi:hypothetical protein
MTHSVQLGRLRRRGHSTQTIRMLQQTSHFSIVERGNQKKPNNYYNKASDFHHKNQASIPGTFTWALEAVSEAVKKPLIRSICPLQHTADTFRFVGLE